MPKNTDGVQWRAENGVKERVEKGDLLKILESTELGKNSQAQEQFKNEGA